MTTKNTGVCRHVRFIRGTAPKTAAPKTAAGRAAMKLRAFYGYTAVMAGIPPRR